METTTAPTSTPVQPEPKPWEPVQESCCKCGVGTRHWTELPERTPGEQVALCEGCAKVTPPVEVPTKTAWCEAVRATLPKIERWPGTA